MPSCFCCKYNPKKNNPVCNILQLSTCQSPSSSLIRLSNSYYASLPREEILNMKLIWFDFHCDRNVWLNNQIQGLHAIIKVLLLLGPQLSPCFCFIIPSLGEVAIWSWGRIPKQGTLFKSLINSLLSNAITAVSIISNRPYFELLCSCEICCRLF